MKVLRTIEELKKWRNALPTSLESGRTLSVGFVPTMGALHDGHKSLLLRASSENDVVILSIFVNPTQFNQKEDLDKYPRPIEADLSVAESCGVTAVFLPDSQNELYPDNFHFKVSEDSFSNQLCGVFRPGHFTGVLSVVMKLLNLMNAERAYFGEKDYQQLELIRQMSAAYFINTKIVPCSTVREKDGLAMSSRNIRLNKEQRTIAPKLYQTLSTIPYQSNSLQDAKVNLEKLGFKFDYLEDRDGRRFVAAWLGDVRLIDNFELVNISREIKPIVYFKKYKILLQVSGSIAAFKAAALASQLIQNGHEVRVVFSSSAEQFVGKATFEGITGKPVQSQIFEEGSMMDHIHLARWADIAILYPASANQINRIALGLSDDLIGALSLAWQKNKPYWIYPAMNPEMWNHSRTEQSISEIQSWGRTIFSPEEGRTACGEIGQGRLLEPETVLIHLNSILNKKNTKRILITAGGTIEPIDAVRVIGNTSTGATGSNIAKALSESGFQVDLLLSESALKPDFSGNLYRFRTFSDLEHLMKELLTNNSYEYVIHSAAVSDFRVKNIEQSKISSDKDIFLQLTPNPKLIQKIKPLSKNPNIKIIAFKLTANEPQWDKVQLNNYSCADWIIHNDISGIDRLNGDHRGTLIKNSSTHWKSINHFTKNIGLIEEVKNLILSEEHLQ